jgi:hypothetical protein
MKIYKLTKYNRFNDTKTEVFYASQEKAEQEKAKILTTYEDAVAKGSGSHWGSVVWDKCVYITEVEVIE